MTSITIPKSITKIGSSAFSCCSLKDIYCYASVPPVSSYDEYLKYKSITLHVPAESIWFYKADKVWKKFKKIKAIE